jgi:hypothetical protein
MRVRISFDALRLCLLVAAGVTSGYLWRAAFESSSPLEARVAEQPRIVEHAPAPPVVRIAPHHLTTTKRAVVRRVIARPVVSAQQRATGALITSHVPAGQPTPPAATPPSTSTPTPTPPKPSPTPTPATPTPATPPAQPTAPTTVASPPVEAAAPPPASQPSNQPNLGESQDDGRPGWGKGDDNHDHSGPGGKGK